MKTIISGIIKQNAIFVLVLGLCSSLAVTTTVESAYMMGFSVLFVLLGSALITSIIHRWVTKEIEIPVYILVIGTFVTILELLMEAYAKELNQVLGIYLPLIVVNCIVLGRTLSVYSKKKTKESLCDALGIGIGYTLSLVLIALIREVLGTGTITLMDSISNLTGYRAVYQIFPNGINLFQKPAGAFLTLGLCMGFFHYLQNRKEDSK